MVDGTLALRPCGPTCEGALVSEDYVIARGLPRRFVGRRDQLGERAVTGVGTRPEVTSMHPALIDAALLCAGGLGRTARLLGGARRQLGGRPFGVFTAEDQRQLQCVLRSEPGVRDRLVCAPVCVEGLRQQLVAAR